MNLHGFQEQYMPPKKTHRFQTAVLQQTTQWKAYSKDASKNERGISVVRYVGSTYWLSFTEKMIGYWWAPGVERQRQEDKKSNSELTNNYLTWVVSPEDNFCIHPS